MAATQSPTPAAPPLVMTVTAAAPEDNDDDDDANFEITGAFAHIARFIPWFRKPRRVLLFKMDVMLVLWMFVAGLMKEMDQSATTQAYVSGMRESLGLYGNELVMFNTFFSIGYALGLVPGQLIQTRLRPSIFLPICEVCWGFFVLFTYKAKNAQTIYGLRFVLGLLSASFWPSVVALLFNWYKPSELAVRLALCTASDVAGAMFLGVLQAALHRDMDGVHGLRGWQWLFIIAGAATVGQGLVAFVAIPDSPATTRALYLTAADKRLARRRMASFGARTSTPVGAAVLRRKLRQLSAHPVTWFFLPAFALAAWAHRANAYFVLYLEGIKDADDGSRVYSVFQVNVLPLGGYALQIVASVGLNALSDRKHWRWQVSIGSLAWYAVILAVLCAWPRNNTVILAFYFLTYSTYAGSSSLMAWMAELLRKEPEARSIIVALTVTIVYVGHATIPLRAFRVADAPRYPVGFPMVTAMTVASILVQLGFLWWDRSHPGIAEYGFDKPATGNIAGADEEATATVEEIKMGGDKDHK
ncbi:Pantothenate transporter liz1 [Beauveria bassiana]|uniref:Pantothenate transporter liz1 n=1 Tax=Beauveria bassiana TaxID=176275 RepID=A0A2N6NUW0_BEABA|nr:Pantothenate transporter liz1 [Beauveria bassiana]